MKSLSKIILISIMALTLAIAALSVLPILAQDVTNVVDGSIIVTGAVSFGADGSIMVAGVIIAPAGAFNPSILAEGD